METNQPPHEKEFASASSRDRETRDTLADRMAKNQTQQQLLEMGARLKELRSAHGYTQQYIADYVGVDKRTYQNWQAGKTPPSQESLEKLAELYEVTPVFILRGEKPGDSDVLARLEHIEEAIGKLAESQARIASVIENLTLARIVDAIADSQASEAPSSSPAPRRVRAARRRPAA